MNPKLGSKVTINEVAERAGVSKTTVSRYINGKYESMSVATRENLEMIIRELDYRPSKTAQRLKADKTGIVGCVIADIRSSFSTNLVKGINDVCAARDYQVLFANTDNDPINEQKSIVSLLDNKLDGLIVNTTGSNDEFLIDLDAQGVPIVMADRYLENDQILDIVTSTNYVSSFECVKFLKDQGYDKVYFVSQTMGNNRNRLIRHQAYCDAMQSYFGMDGNTSSYFICGEDCEGEENQVLDILKDIQAQNEHKNVCIFAVNGTVLLELVKTMKENDYQIGKDFGLCGFDDWEWASLIDPGITTIRQDTYMTGVLSANILIDRIENKDNGDKRLVELPTEIIKRNSTTILE